MMAQQGDHRLAAGAAMAAAQQAESDRRAAMSPAGNDPGIQLADMTDQERAALGMSAAAQVPSRGPLQPPDWPPPLRVEQEGQ